MHIGLIGGIGPAATDYYYRQFISRSAAVGHGLELTMAHADIETLLRHLEAGDEDAQAAVYQHLTKRLKAAGAECVLVTSIAGHFCIEAFEDISPLPVVSIISAVGQEIERLSFDRVGLIGTRKAMASRLYDSVKSADVVVPHDDLMEDVSRAYADMAAAGSVKPAYVETFQTACDHLVNEQGADVVLLGGTDLALVIDDLARDYPILDSAGAHVDATMRQLQTSSA